MAGQTPAELLPAQRDATSLARAGEWLFRHRTATVIPLILALFGLRIGAAPPSLALLATGIGLVAAGETLRLWSVRHIGVISRTRSDRLGPLVESGPFAHVRNPLYLGNIMLWIGLALSARLLWLVPLVLLLLAAQYHAIVCWEEGLLEERLGAPYRAYRERVPRWVPTFGPPSPSAATPFSWRQVLFSERGTLAAIATACLLLWIKNHL